MHPCVIVCGNDFESIGIRILRILSRLRILGILKLEKGRPKSWSSRQCDKHLEMVATKIADHVELPISQLNIS